MRHFIIFYSNVCFIYINILWYVDHTIDKTVKKKYIYLFQNYKTVQKASEAEIIKKVDGIMESDADISAKQNYDIYLFFLR